MPQTDIQLEWLDALAMGVEGRGWTDTVAPYDRLPAHAASRVPPAVWDLSRSATGMSVRFRTDAYQIHARWRLRDTMLGEANFAVAGFSGLDLYGDDGGAWRWVAATQNVPGQDAQACIAEGTDGRERAYQLYLPLRNPVERLEIGVPRQARFTPLPPRSDRPLVFYGTSIVHGAYASRAGLAYPAILGRRLDRPIVNLGFSGSARMEIELAHLLAELNARVYILDPLPNMDLALVNERADTFVRTLRSLRPGTPVVLVEDFPRTNAWIRPAVREAVATKCRRFREIIAKLQSEGIPDLHYVDGRLLLGDDGEASIDGIHPSDLGYMRMADAIAPVLAPLCAPRATGGNATA